MYFNAGTRTGGHSHKRPYLESQHILVLVDKVPNAGSGAQVALHELCRPLQSGVLLLLLLEHASPQLRQCSDCQVARAVRGTVAGGGMRKASSVVLRVHVCNRTIFSFGVASATESIFPDFEDTGSKLTREPGVANYTKFPSHSSPPPHPPPPIPIPTTPITDSNFRY